MGGRFGAGVLVAVEENTTLFYGSYPFILILHCQYKGQDLGITHWWREGH